MSNKNTIQYRRVDDYLIPNFIIPPEEAKITLGEWGMLHKDYLYKHKPVAFASLLTEGKLWQYLAQIDIQAQEMYDTLIEQMKENENITEKLKEVDQMEWVCRMQNIESMVRGIVFNDIIYI